MTTVYVITDGDYSGYHIVRVYLDKEKAEHFIELHKDRHGWKEGHRIEEWDTSDDLDPSQTEIDHGSTDTREGYYVYLYPLTLSRLGWNGPEPVIQSNVRTWKEGELEMEICMQDYARGVPYPCIRIPFDRARNSMDVAKKIFTDKLAQYKAEQEGIA